MCSVFEYNLNKIASMLINDHRNVGKKLVHIRTKVYWCYKSWTMWCFWMWISLFLQFRFNYFSKIILPWGMKCMLKIGILNANWKSAFTLLFGNAETIHAFFAKVHVKFVTKEYLFFHCRWLFSSKFAQLKF